jgi:hypothetical protein
VPEALEDRLDQVPIRRSQLAEDPPKVVASLERDLSAFLERLGNGRK